MTDDNKLQRMPINEEIYFFKHLHIHCTYYKPRDTFFLYFSQSKHSKWATYQIINAKKLWLTRMCNSQDPV